MTGPFGGRPSLLSGTSLEVPDLYGSEDGILPDLEVGPVTDPSELGRVEDPENDPTDRVPTTAEGQANPAVREQADNAGELLNQEGNTGPDRGTSDAPRGTPVTDGPPGTGGLAREYYRRGEARIRALTELFGQDAMVLGHLLFKVPPLAIRIKKGNLTYRWKPLRTQESIAVKSGNGECYIEVDLAFVGLNQINHSLADLVALWKSVPFCFIENIHIRKMMIPDNPEESMAVCLETLVMDAVAGRPNTVYATLIMRWFNYKPFSQNFWFRREYRPAEGLLVEDNTARPTGRPREDSADEPGAREGGTATGAQRSGGTVLVDLSAINDPTTLAVMAQDHPPEVGLLEPIQVGNPGDPTIDGTYPVVYPFNSEPFLQRVASVGRPQRVLGWNDSLTMNWNSFVRMPVPRSWSYTIDNSPRVAVSASPRRGRTNSPGSTTPRAGQGRIPPAVTGDRDIIIFIGDSIMVGFTSNETRGATQQRASGVSFFRFSGNDRMPATEGFTYYGMMRVGANSRTMRSWWNQKKNISEWKAEGNDAACSRVAGVVIHSGSNDGHNGPFFDELEQMMTEISGYGAIPILCCLPPSGDATHITPAQRSQLRQWWGDARVEAYHAAIADYHGRMQRMANGISNGMFIDYHPQMVEPRFRGNRAAPLAEQYMRKNSPRAPYYNIHWNLDGYTQGGNYIHGLLPWNSFRGISPPADAEPETWTVCHVEDGDTVWAWGNDDSGERTLRAIRMQYIDCLETYHVYTNAEFNRGGARALPEGQDSYRPDDAKYGSIAAKALRSQLPNGTQITVQWGGTGYYGRYLGEIFKGDVNMNLWMVEQGHAFAVLPSNPSHGEEIGEHEVGFDYWVAQEIAAGRRSADEGPPGSARGIWSAVEVPLINPPSGLTAEDARNLASIMMPSDFRNTYAPSSDGGHGGSPGGCAEEATRGYIIVNGTRINTSFPVNHSLQFNVGEHNVQARSASSTTQGILHWTGAEGSGRTVYNTLVGRNLSCHFSLDRDGTLWQYCDAATTISHSACTAINNVAWSIEITCYGVQTSRASRVSAARSRETYEATIQGEPFTVGDYTEEQYTTVLELCNLIHTALSIPKVAFTSPQRFVGYSAAGAARGVIGHYHGSRVKTDPGPRIFERLAALPGWSSGSL